MKPGMRVLEIFRALQGEGPIAGAPVTFIRFAGCNLRCSFCDTKYAHDPSELLNETEIWHALQLAQDNNDTFVITGGEPFLQQDAILRIFAQIHTLADVWFETNGTIVPDYRILERDWVQTVASPKPTHTNVSILQALADMTRLHLKFVIGTDAWHENDALWVVNEVRKGGQLDPDAVYFMPQGATREEQLANMPRVWELCLKHRVRFSPRLHTLTYGNRRGV